MTKFSREKVLLLHQLIAQETGGEVGLRDQALLDAALAAVFAGADREFYPTKPSSVGFASTLPDRGLDVWKFEG